MQLPPLDPQSRQQLNATRALLLQSLQQAGGSLPFDRYMELALYAPGHGYYVNGSRKFGEDGDFVTAPEISSVFSRCLANQCAQVLGELGSGDVLEFGAGTGRMAADMLLQLQQLDCLPERYLILELSPDLQACQRETLQQRAPELLPRVHWLSELPAAGFRGVVVANELLDAMPVQRFRKYEGAWQELFVGVQGADFVDRWQVPQTPGLQQQLDSMEAALGPVADGFESEVNLRLGPWLQALAERMSQGSVILVDYGYARREYYHPEREQGTLICHFRHRAHSDAYLLPGVQDITANVDFTAVAEAGIAVGFSLAGYTSQAYFLMSNGLDALVMDSDPGDVATHMALVQGIKKLTLPGEMGERFKVIALNKSLDLELNGFQMRDMREQL